MAKRAPVSVLVITKNEESNIRLCLESVKWAGEIVVVDSHSADRTVDIAGEYTGKVYQYTWDGKWPKKSWSLEVPEFSNDWILMIDADERATPEFREELGRIIADEDNGYSGYIVRYRYWFLGRHIRYGDPVRKVALFKKSRSHFEKFDLSGAEGTQSLETGHEHPIIDGRIGVMESHLIHDDKRPLYFYFDRHNHYSTWEALLIHRKMYRDPSSEIIRPILTGGNKISLRRFFKYIFLKLPFKPFIYFIYSYIFRLGFLDGYAGLVYNICKAFYVFQIGLKVHELKMRKRRG